MARASHPTEYSIAAVSKLSGVSCHVLRVWERRYGYPRPQRSASNQRRYSADQVLVLQRLAELTRGGRPIGELMADFREERLDVAPGPVPQACRGATSGLVDALFSGDLAAADALIAGLSEGLTPLEQLVRVVEPALIEVGERWFSKAAEIYQEHLATGVLLRALGRLLDQARRSNPGPSRLALVSAMNGERHEGGILLLCVGLELSGWRALPMGCDLSAAELARAIDAWRPDAVGVSFVLSRNINKRFRELSALREVPIFVGGRSLMNHKGLARRHGLIPMTGSVASVLPQWQAEFDRWRADRSGATEA